MKYLLVVLVVVVVLWLMLRQRKPQRPPSGARASSTPAQGAGAQTMVQCQHCGVHLPRADAVLDLRGAFCSPAHQLAGPRAR